MKAAAIFGLRARWKDAEPFAREGAIITQAGSPPAKADAVLIFGGDGTINRHLSKLVELGIPALIVPVGSGNDFARAIGIGTVEQALAAWNKFVRGEANVRAVDVGVITPLTAEAQRRRDFAETRSGSVSGGARAVDVGVITPLTAEAQRRGDSAEKTWRKTTTNAAGLMKEHNAPNRLFCCIGGTGFDSETNRRANALPWWLRAHGGYVIAAARTLVTWKPVALRVAMLDIGVTLDEPASFVVFANAPSYGDGMRIAPHAVLDDGLLDVCFVRGTTRMRITRHFASIYSGSHLSLPEVEYFQVSRLCISTERPMDIYADGEFMCRAPIEVSVLPKALKVIA